MHQNQSLTAFVEISFLTLASASLALGESCFVSCLQCAWAAGYQVMLIQRWYPMNGFYVG